MISFLLVDLHINAEHVLRPRASCFRLLTYENLSKSESKGLDSLDLWSICSCNCNCFLVSVDLSLGQLTSICIFYDVLTSR